jgi:predicted ferric reductase
MGNSSPPTPHIPLTGPAVRRNVPAGSLLPWSADGIGGRDTWHPPYRLWSSREILRADAYRPDAKPMISSDPVVSNAPASCQPGGVLGAPLRSAEMSVLPTGARVASRSASSKGLWIAAYCLAAVLPLFAVLLSSPPGGRGLVLELGSALGIVALTLLALQLVLPARLGVVARPLGAEVAIRLHRHMADVLVAAIAAHVALVVVGDTSNVALFDPLGAPWRAKAAVASCVALAALIATSVLRRRLRLPYARWRGLHSTLGIGALALGLLHAIGVDRYLTNGASGLFTAGLAGLGVLGLVELRLLRPRRLARRAYLVERVDEERGGATTLALRADGHRGHRFRPGQFAWLKLADAPHALVEHPFSYSSSAGCPEQPTFTIKAYGDFTSRVPQLQPGTRVLVDGPHGSYRARRHAERFVLIAGGIGITPIISMLRSAADTGDRRPFVLVYGSLRWEEITFREELQRLEQRLDLRVVHVLTEPPPDWEGEAGFVDTDLLARHLPADLRRSDVFLCGPPPMLTAALNGLERLGVAPEHVHAEQFVTV